MNSRDYPIHETCLLCGSNDLRPMEQYAKHYLVQCAACRFVFAERIPSQQELIDHYSTYGRNDYLSPITVKRYHEILDFLEPFRQTNKMIDVGCGVGHFLGVAKERGWEVHGTEFTDAAISICEAKGIYMHKGNLDPANYSAGAFDVIVSFEVIEHINNPNEELQYFNDILRKGGAVYMTTPNFSSLSRYYLKSNWSVLEYPEHLCYYTANTLNRAMKQNGFNKKWVKATGISLTRFRSSMKRIKPEKKAADPPKDQPVELIGSDTADEKLRSRMENNPLLRSVKFTIDSLLTVLRKGDNMKALYIKS